MSTTSQTFSFSVWTLFDARYKLQSLRAECGPLTRLELLGHLWIQCTDSCEDCCGADDYPAREWSREHVPHLHVA